MIKIAIYDKCKWIRDLLHMVVLKYSFRTDVDIDIKVYNTENDLEYNSNYNLILNGKCFKNSEISEEKIFEIINNYLKKIRNEKSFLILKSVHDNKVVEIKNILFVEAMGKHSLVHVLNDKCRIEVLELISSIEEKLDSNFFCRCHRSCIVNLSHVVSYNKIHAKLVTGDKVEISRRKYRDFENQLNMLLRNR